MKRMKKEGKFRRKVGMTWGPIWKKKKAIYSNTITSK